MDNRERLLRLLRTLAYREGDFTLRSGEKSRYYLDGKQVTMRPEGAYLLAQEILERLRGLDIAAIAGPTLGADPIVGAVCALSYSNGTPLAALIVRKETKDHGTGQLVEGPTLPPGSPVAVVEDVITRGGMVKHSIQALESAGYRVARVLCLVDRQSTGVQELRDAGYVVDPIFTLEDVRSVPFNTERTES
ncbi:MAG TPA: orotate phosphoribosyltransferase [Armatimonadota bacterium]|nr:orotate phosphoribosyltransferase [Armatimonadota bacterium]